MDDIHGSCDVNIKNTRTQHLLVVSFIPSALSKYALEFLQVVFSFNCLHTIKKQQYT